MKFLRKKNDETETKRSRQKFKFQDNQELVLNSNNLVPVVLQDVISREVLHLGYMDRWALNTSLEHKLVYLYRRSKGRLEKFGSKNNLEYKIISVKLDQSRRSLLMTVSAVVSEASKTDTVSSFVRKIEIP